MYNNSTPWKKSGCTILLVCLITGIYSQENKSPGPAKTNGRHAVNRYHEVLRYNEPIMYVAFPVIKPIVERKLLLEDGEGKDGYWAEAHFGHRFVGYEGKHYSPALLQRLRLTMDVSMLARLTRDDSNPILPYSNRFGLGLDILLSSLKKLEKGEAGMLWTTLQLHHYSNGQADSFFIDSPVKRNNYKSGDFSSNYWRITMNLSSNADRMKVIFGGLGYQREIDLSGPLSSSKQLKHYYGDGRLLFYLHLIKQSKLEVEMVNRGISNGNNIKKHVRRHVGIRTELDYITGDLSDFNGESKYRWAWRNYLTYMPSVTNEIGFMMYTSIGRDYLNIRFDDIVFVGGLGIYVCFK